MMRPVQVGPLDGSIVVGSHQHTIPLWWAAFHICRPVAPSRCRAFILWQPALVALGETIIG
jgi:hypothetical protein